LRKDADWRGSPRATTRREFNQLLRILNPSKNDVFYDLGCGHAMPCIWIAPRVKLAIGIEDHYYRYLRAKAEVERSGYKNVVILRDDIMNPSYRDATIVYSVISIGFQVIKKIQNQAKTGTVIVLYGLPPYPIKTRKLFGNFVFTKTPIERVSNEDEYAKIHLDRKKATIEDLYKTLDEDEVKDLEREIRGSDDNWKRLPIHE